MNRTMIIYILGCILKTEGVLMALPCLVALIYHESQGINYRVIFYPYNPATRKCLSSFSLNTYKNI